MPLANNPQVVRKLAKNQRSKPVWVILVAGVLGLGNVALAWHRLWCVLEAERQGQVPQVKSSELVLTDPDIAKAKRIMADLEAALIKHGLLDTFTAWIPPAMQDMDREQIQALLQQQLTLAGLSREAAYDILGALYLPRDPVTLDIIQGEVHITATDNFVFEVLLTTDTTQAQDNPDPTVITGTWKLASVNAAVAQLLVTMERPKAARLHLRHVARAVETGIASGHWSSGMYTEVRQVLEDVKQVRDNPDVNQVAAQLGNMGVQEPTIAEELANAMENLQALTVYDDDTVINKMLPLAAAQGGI